MDITHHFIEIQGFRTHYIASGQGEAVVVLLHGGGIDSAALSWGAFLPELAQAYRVIAFDWPGYGESALLGGRTCSVEFLVSFLEDFFNALRIQKSSLVGISMGGAAALGFTLRFPEWVEKLVLVDSYGLQRRAQAHLFSYLFVRLPGVNALSWKMLRSRAMLRWSLRALLRRPGSLTEELLEQAHRQMLRPGAEQAFMSFQRDEMCWSGVRTTFLDRLGEIQAPTLIVHGTLDSSVPPDCVREAHVRLPGSRLYWMEGCGHWPQRDNPAEFNRVVKSFLRSG